MHEESEVKVMRCVIGCEPKSVWASDWRKYKSHGTHTHNYKFKASVRPFCQLVIYPSHLF